MKQQPFWVDDFERPSGLGTDTLPDKSDHVIIGSGLTGLAAATRLSAGGEMVTVLDSTEIAGGASSINGGMVSPDVKAGIRAVLDAYGPDIADQVWHASVRSVDLVAQLCNDHQIDARINRDGMAALGFNDHDRKKFEATIHWYRSRYGVEWELLDPDRVGEVAGSESFHAALFEPEGFGLHPARYSFGLAGAASRAGAQLVSNTPVTGITHRGDGYDVETPNGVVRAGNVIAATNGYTDRQPIPELQKRIVSIGSYIVVTDPLSPDDAKTVFPANAMTYTKRRLLHYMRRTPDDRILIGGRRNLKTNLPLDESARDLMTSLVGYFPQLSDVEVSHVWGGKLGVPFDLTPHIGRIDGVWYAVGYAGHGVGLSTLLGHDLAGMLLGEEPASPFAQIPHKGRFYYRGNPWFLNSASLLYRTLDRFGL